MKKLNPIGFDKAEELSLKLGNASIRSTMNTHNHVVKQVNELIDQDNAAKQASGGYGFMANPIVILAATLGFLVGYLITKF